MQASPEVEGLFVVPATIDLAGAEIELVSVVARESRLRKALHGLPGRSSATGEDRFDYVLIDCPPSLGLLTLNALVAGDEMLIPIQAEYYALEGLGQLLETVEMVKAHLNPELEISTILLTMYDARTRLSAGVAEEVRAHFGDRVLRTAIPRSVRISEAPSYGQTVMTYDPGSPGALSYLEAAREMATQRSTPDDPEARAAPGTRPGARVADPDRRPAREQAVTDGAGRNAARAPVPRRQASVRRRHRPRAAAHPQEVDPGGAEQSAAPSAGAARRAGRPPAGRTGPTSPSSRSTRSARTRASPARSSTRRRWPSWSTRSGGRAAPAGRGARRRARTATS